MIECNSNRMHYECLCDTKIDINIKEMKGNYIIELYIHPD